MSARGILSGIVFALFTIGIYASGVLTTLTSTSPPTPTTGPSSPSPAAGTTSYTATVTTSPTIFGTTILHATVTNTGTSPGTPTCTISEGSTPVAEAHWRRPIPLPPAQTWNFKRIKPTTPDTPTITCT